MYQTPMYAIKLYTYITHYWVKETLKLSKKLPWTTDPYHTLNLSSNVPHDKRHFQRGYTLTYTNHLGL